MESRHRFPSFRCSWLAMAIYACIWTATTRADRFLGVGIIQPETYASPNGTYTLFVDSGDRYGHGSAKYKFSKNGTEVWSGEREYALREVCVTDQGHVSGFAYRQIEIEPTPNAGGDPEHPLRYHDPDEFLHIVILDADGRELRNEEIKRSRFPGSSTPPMPSTPVLFQVIPDVQNDRIIYRAGARGGQCWVYSLSTGEQTAKVDAESLFEDDDRFSFVVDVQPIKNSPLLLIHGYIKSHDWKLKDDGGRFSIVDKDLKPIWSLDAANDYDDLDLFKNSFMGGGPEDFFEREPAIRVSNEPRQFDVRLFKEGKTVSFEAKRTTEGDYAIQELGRIDSKFENPQEKRKARIEAALEAFTPLPYLGEVKLATESENDAPFKELWDFTFDKDGIIYVMEKCTTPPCDLVMLDPTGKLLGRRPMTERNDQCQFDWSDCAKMGDGKYFLKDALDRDADSSIKNTWWVDLRTGEKTPAGLHLKGLNGQSRFPDGGMIVLGSFQQNSSMIEQLIRYAPDGSEIWHLRSKGYGDDDPFGIGAQDVAVTSDGRAVLLSMSSVRFLDPNGKVAKKIDLTGAFGRDDFGGRPGYLNAIHADRSGGFFLMDMGNPPVVIRYNSDGEQISRWSPRHADGKTFSNRGRICMDFQGAFWTSDGKSLFQLNNEGIVERTIGSAPKNDELAGLAGFTVDQQGNLYAVAKDSGVVHKFTSEGKSIRRFEPDPKDVAGTVSDSFVAVNDKGDVFLKKPATRVFMPPDEYLRFSADGTRMDSMTFQPSVPVGQFLSAGWSFQPRTGYRFGMCGIKGDNRLVIVDPPDKLIREERRRPNGNWFGHWSNLSMGRDGTMAVLNSDLMAKPPRYEVDLFTELGDGIRTFLVPEPVDRWNAIAHDATRIIIAGNKELLVMELQGARQQRFALSDEDTQWSLFILPSGRQLLMFGQRSNRVHRYELPPIE